MFSQKGNADKSYSLLTEHINTRCDWNEREAKTAVPCVKVRVSSSESKSTLYDIRCFALPYPVLTFFLLPRLFLYSKES